MKLTHKCACPAHDWDRTWFTQIMGAIHETVYKNRYTDNTAHSWHPALVCRFPLHPVVELMLAYKPNNTAQLVLEWPHVSETDANLLAYTRDDSKGIADIQTTTSVGKYVARHWPRLPDHIRRDVCSLYTPDELFFVDANVESFADIVDTGPKSCMQSNWNGRADWEIHPYTVYDPALGWGMAARRSNGQIDGRALTYTHTDSYKVFVRAYSRNENGYSQGDVALAAWLVSQGYRHADSFEDAVIAQVTTHDGELVAPYIDGDADHLAQCSDNTFTIVRKGGEYVCDKTNGTATPQQDEDEEDYIGRCEDCDASIAEGDDYGMVGRSEDRMVCNSCQDDYTYVTGAGRRYRTCQYYVNKNDVLEVNGRNYDEANLPDYIMQLRDGDYFNSDTDDYCEIDGEYYLTDDSRVVLCDDGEHRLMDDCWQCDGSRNWYSDDEDAVELSDGKYHASYLADLVTSKQVAPCLWTLQPPEQLAAEYCAEPATA